MEFDMENMKILSQIVFLSGWSVIAAYLAKKVGKMSEDFHAMALSLREISTNYTGMDRTLSETKGEVRELHSRVGRLEGGRRQ